MKQLSNSPFVQQGPSTANAVANNPTLKRLLAQSFSPDELETLLPRLIAFADRCRTEVAALGDRAEANPPQVSHYGAWGARVDRLHVDPAWDQMLRIAAQGRLIAEAYERKYGSRSRLIQVALVQAFHPHSAVATCPLAMTDGCSRILETHGRAQGLEQAEEYWQNLTSDDPSTAWTAGQWMTEKEGGSDVGRSSTVARKNPDGSWSLTGTKYFTSATTAQISLTLARCEGAPTGSKGLSLFVVEPWMQADGSPRDIRVRRLKPKMGTKALPTAELELDGVRAQLIGPENGGGVRLITTMLNVCRHWNAMTATAWIFHHADQLSLTS